MEKTPIYRLKANWTNAGGVSTQGYNIYFICIEGDRNFFNRVMWVTVRCQNVIMPNLKSFIYFLKLQWRLVYFILLFNWSLEDFSWFFRYLYYKSQFILNLITTFYYLRLKSIWINPTTEISLEIIFFFQKISLLFLKVVGLT